MPHGIHDRVHHRDIFDGEILGVITAWIGMATALDIRSSGGQGQPFMAGRAMSAPVIPEIAMIPCSSPAV